jgi:hypothetical protein
MLIITTSFIARPLMKKPTNPIAITAQPLAGRQLPSGFSKAPVPTTTTFDQRDLSSLWKDPQWTSKISADTVQNAVRGARLSSAFWHLVGTMQEQYPDEWAIIFGRKYLLIYRSILDWRRGVNRRIGGEAIQEVPRFSCYSIKGSFKHCSLLLIKSG